METKPETTNLPFLSAHKCLLYCNKCLLFGHEQHECKTQMNYLSFYSSPDPRMVHSRDPKGKKRSLLLDPFFSHGEEDFHKGSVVAGPPPPPTTLQVLEYLLTPSGQCLLRHLGLVLYPCREAQPCSQVMPAIIRKPYPKNRRSTTRKFAPIHEQIVDMNIKQEEVTTDWVEQVKWENEEGMQTPYIPIWSPREV